MTRMNTLLWATTAYGGMIAAITLITLDDPSGTFAQAVSNFRLFQGLDGLYAFYVLLTFPYAAWLTFAWKQLSNAAEELTG